MSSGLKIPLIIENEAQAKKTLKEVGNSLRQLNSELKTISSSYDKNNKAVEDYKKEQEQLTKIIEKQKNKIDVLKQTYQMSSKTAGENSNKTTEWKLQLEQAQRTLQKYENCLKQSREEMQALEIETQKALESTKKLEDEQSKSAEKGVFNTSAIDIGTKMSTTITAPLIGGLTAGAKITADFEKSMSNVQAVSQATGSELELLSDKAKEMGASTSKSASEAADALGYMALAGWDTSQMIMGLEPILRASEAGGMELATCSDLVTDSMSSLGVTTNDLGHYLDIVTQAQNNSNTSMQSLLEAYVVCGGTLKNLNVPLEESASLLGVLANRGIKSAEAGTSLNSILVNLIGANSTAATAMKDLGISAWDTDGNFIGVTETLKILQEALSNCTEEEKAMFEAHIGGKTQMDTLQALLSGVSEEYEILSEKMYDCEGVMKSTALIMQDNLAGDFTTLKSQLEATGITVGEIVTPQIRQLVQSLTDGFSAFNNLDQGTQRLITSTIVFASAIGPLLVVTGKLSSSVNNSITIIKGFVDAINSGKSVMQAFTIVCNANPFLLLASAISVVVAAFTTYKLTSQIDETEKFISNIKAETEAIKSNCKAMVERSKQTDDSIAKTNSEISVEQKHLENLKDKIPTLEELAEKTNKTADEEAELKAIIDEMNKAMPDLKLAIDNETGALSSNTSEIIKNIDAYKKLAETKGIAKNIETVSEQVVSSEINRSSTYDDILSTINKSGYNKTLRNEYKEFLDVFESIERGNKQAIPSLDKLPIIKKFKLDKNNILDAQREQLNELINTYIEANSEYVKADSQLNKLYSKQEQLTEQTDSKIKNQANKTNKTNKTKYKKSSDLPDDIKDGIKNWEYMYQAGTISQKKYLQEIERIRDEYFENGSLGWNEYNAKITSIKNESKNILKSTQKNISDIAKIEQEAQKKLSEENKNQYENHIKNSFNWIAEQEFKDNWNEIDDSIEQAYNRVLEYAEKGGKQLNIQLDVINENIEKINELKKKAEISKYEEDLEDLEDFISDRNFYMDWDKFNINETDIIKEEQKLLDKYYNDGLLAKKDYISKSKSLNKQLYTANKEVEDNLANEVTAKWDKILNNKRIYIDKITKKINDSKNEIENQYQEEDRQKNLDKLKQQANVYKNAVTSAGKEKYENVMSQIEQLERESQRAKLDEENNRIIAELEAEYSELEQKKAQELENFKSLSITEQQTTNELLEKIVKELDEQTFNDNYINRENEQGGISNLQALKTLETTELENYTKQYAEAIKEIDIIGILQQIRGLTENIKEATATVYNNTDNSSRNIDVKQYVRDNSDLDILNKSLKNIIEI